MMTVTERLTQALGESPRAVAPLHGGCIGQVLRVELADRALVAKVDPGARPRLDREAYMLRYLAQHSALPVPQVVYSAPDLLIMTWLPGRSRFDAAAQQHAAELLAALHAVSQPTFGLARDTLIGGLHQPNTPGAAWLPFFREQRLHYMAHRAHQRGLLPADLLHRIDRLAARLDEWLSEPAHPALIHGDVWTTNVLAQDGRITGLIDPAIYYADPEIELAFTTLFGTFSKPFFDRYAELRPLSPNFFSERRDLYNLYPLLVHVNLFGRSYLAPIGETLARFGC